MKRLLNDIRILWILRGKLKGDVRAFQEWAIWLNEDDWQVLKLFLEKLGRDGCLLVTDLSVRRRLARLR